MFNAYYDIDTGTRFTPYVGAGLGYAHLKAKANGDVYGSESADNLAWQLGAGVSYAATDNISVDLGYRYTDYGSLTSKYSDEDGSEKFKIDSDANEFYLGVRYAF
jgi:outer membrane autotransporter protein